MQFVYLLIFLVIRKLVFDRATKSRPNLCSSLFLFKIIHSEFMPPVALITQIVEVSFDFSFHHLFLTLKDVSSCPLFTTFLFFQGPEFDEQNL